MSPTLPRKKNPLNLNTLQLKTLTVFQILSGVEGCASPPDANGDIAIFQLPHAHGNHFHVGDALLATKDTTGLHVPAVWAVLERKGLIRPQPSATLAITAAGLAYDTGLRDTLLIRSDH